MRLYFTNGSVKYFTANWLDKASVRETSAFSFSTVTSVLEENEEDILEEEF
jgi:hypothetical protein